LPVPVWIAVTFSLERAPVAPPPFVLRGTGSIARLA